MIFKNNSDREWLQYNCGEGIIIDIKPQSVFEVKNEKAAAMLLRNLGAPNWITVSEEKPPVIKQVSESKVVTKAKKMFKNKDRLKETLKEINKE